MQIGKTVGIDAHRQLQMQDTYRVRALERLSSGLRINRSADDAGGLAISEAMRAQVRGSFQAMRNVQDGISMLQTADGNFEQIHLMLQRMREISVQGANGTYSTADRLAMQQELEQLKQGIDQIAYSATFNGIKLLVDQDKVLRPTPSLPYAFNGTDTNPDPEPTGAFAANPDSALFRTAGGGTVNGVTRQEVLDAYAQLPYLLDGALRKAEGMLRNTGLDQTTIVPPPDIYFVIDPTSPTRYSVSDVATNSIVINLFSVSGAPLPTNPRLTLQQAVERAVSDFALKREDDAAGAAGDVATFSSTFAGPYGNMSFLFTETAAESYLGYTKPAAISLDTLDADGGRAASAWFGRFLVETYGQSAIEEIADRVINAEGAGKATMGADIDTYLFDLMGATSHADIEAAANAWMATVTATPAQITNALNNTLATLTSSTPQLLGGETDLDLVIQAGANTTQFDTAKLNLYAGALGNLDYAGMVAVTDQGTARRSIGTLDRSIAIVSQARAGIGAQINGFENAYDNLAATAENMTRAESQIRDADMAAEVVEQTKRAFLGVTASDALLRNNQLARQQIQSLLSPLSEQRSLAS